MLALLEFQNFNWKNLHPRNVITTLSAPFKAADGHLACVWSVIILSPVQWLGWKTVIWNPLADLHQTFFMSVLTVLSWGVFFLACLWPLGTHFTDEDGAEPHFYSLVTLGALGFWFMFGAVTLWGYAIRIIINSSRRYRGLPPVNRSRYAAVIWAVIAGLWAQHVSKGNSPLVAHEVEMTLPNWPSCLDGYKIILMSDLHIGPAVGRSNVDEVVELVSKQEDVDLILLAGDVADGPPSLRSKAVEPLTTMSATDGVYYVTGNHDYMHGSTGTDWIEWFAASGTVDPLINRKVVLPKDSNSTKWKCGGTFQLMGVPDFTAKPDLPGVWNTTKVEDGPRVLLAHQPNQWRSARKMGVDLQLSGHTHGGHWFPWAGLVYLCNVAIAGKVLYPPTQSQMYISDGVFAWGARIRLPTSDNAIAVVTVRRLPEGEEIPWPYDIGSMFGGCCASMMLMIVFGNISATRRGISWTWFCYSLGFAAVAYTWRHLWWYSIEKVIYRFAHHNNMDS